MQIHIIIAIFLASITNLWATPVVRPICKTGEAGTACFSRLQNAVVTGVSAFQQGKIASACRQMGYVSTISTTEDEVAKLRAEISKEKTIAERKLAYKTKRKELDKERFCVSKVLWGVACSRYADEDEKLGLKRNDCLQDRAYSKSCNEYEAALLSMSIEERIRLNKVAREEAAKKKTETAEKKPAEQEEKKVAPVKTESAKKVLSAEEKRRVLEKQLSEVRVCEKELKAFITLRCLRYADETEELARERVLCENDAGIDSACKNMKRLFDSVSIEARIQLNKDRKVGLASEFVVSPKEVEPKAVIVTKPIPDAKPAQAPAPARKTVTLGKRIDNKQRAIITNPVCKKSKQKAGYCEQYDHENDFEAYLRLRCIEGYINNFNGNEIQERACQETNFEIAGLPIYQQAGKIIAENPDIKTRPVLIENAGYDRIILEQITYSKKEILGRSPQAPEAKVNHERVLRENTNKKAMEMPLTRNERKTVDREAMVRGILESRRNGSPSKPSANNNSALAPTIQFDLGEDAEFRDEATLEISSEDMQDLVKKLNEIRQCSQERGVASIEGCKQFKDESEEDAKLRLECIAEGNSEINGKISSCSLYDDRIQTSIHERIAIYSKNAEDKAKDKVEPNYFYYSLPNYIGPISDKKPQQKPVNPLLHSINAKTLSYPRMIDGRLCIEGTQDGVCRKYYDSSGPKPSSIQEQKAAPPAEKEYRREAKSSPYTPTVMRGTDRRDIFRVIYKFNMQLPESKQLKFAEINEITKVIQAEEARGGWTAAESLTKMYKESAFSKGAISEQSALGLMQILYPSENGKQRAMVRKLAQDNHIKSKFPKMSFDQQLLHDPVFNYQIAAALNHMNRQTFDIAHPALLDTCYYVGCHKIAQTVDRLRGEDSDNVVWSVLRNGDPKTAARGSRAGYKYARDTFLMKEYMETVLRDPGFPLEPKQFTLTDSEFMRMMNNTGKKPSKVYKLAQDNEA